MNEVNSRPSPAKLIYSGDAPPLRLCYHASEPVILVSYKEDIVMPRCGTDQIVIPPVSTGPGGPGSHTLTIETPDGDIKVTGARVVRISRGEWHPIQIQSGEVWMEVNTSLYYPAMDLVMRWEP